MKTYILSFALLLPTAGYASNTAVIDQFECRWSDLRAEWHQWDQCACRMFDKKLDCKHEIKKLRALIDSTIEIAQKQNHDAYFAVIGAMKVVGGFSVIANAHYRDVFNQGVGLGLMIAGWIEFMSAIANSKGSIQLDRLIELRKRIDRFLNTIE